MKNGMNILRRYWEELRIGIFFIMALVILFYTLMSLKEAQLFKLSYNITAKFLFSEGLRPSSPVRFCGVDVGEVKDIYIKDENGRPTVFVIAKIDYSIKIPRDSYFFVNSLSLFGEKYLEISPGPARNGDCLKNTDVVQGLSSKPLFAVTADFDKTMEELSEFVKDGKLKDALGNTLLSLEKAAGDIKDITGQVNSKQGTIGRLFYDDSLYRSLDEFLADLKAHPWKLLYKTDDKK
jgi:phospholipid/cholesterol/gamma-HCH transport system substrate-binding protein